MEARARREQVLRGALAAAIALTSLVSSNALAQVQYPDGFLSGGGSSSSTVSGGWLSALDCTTATDTPQLLPNVDGGTFTMCGQTAPWTHTAVNLSKGGDAVDGGLILQCTGIGGTGFPFVDDSVYVSLSTLIPGFSGQTPLRVSVWIQNPTTVGTASNQFEAVAIDNEPTAGTGVVESASVAFRQFSGFTLQDTPEGTSQSFSDVAVGAGYNVVELYFPAGVSLSLHSYVVAVYDGGLPELGGDVPLEWKGMNGNATNNSYQLGISTNFNVYLTCANALGSGTTTTNFGRIKIEYKK